MVFGAQGFYIYKKSKSALGCKRTLTVASLFHHCLNAILLLLFRVTYSTGRKAL